MTGTRFKIAVAMLAVCTNASAVVIGTTEVPLNGAIADVRSIETNWGNLLADSFYWQSAQNGLTPTIGFLNGGTIRTGNIAFPGATPALPANIDDTFVSNTFPFGNKVVIIEDVNVTTLLQALENSVSQVGVPVPGATGRFLQVSGLRFSWATGAGAGSRIIDVVLNDGTALVDDGAIVSNLLLDIATNDFVALNGDFYSMFPGTFTDSGSTDSQALTNFITTALGGTVRAGDYPANVNDRIFRDTQLVAVAVPEPATILLFALGMAGIGWRLRGRR